jgi:NAD(P)-dependent dehydrogenase (short-subunit alcohol dehydrogenase family)
LRAAAAEADTDLTVVAMDVTEPESVRLCVTDVLANTGEALDALVNNAGIGDSGCFEDMSDEQVRRVMETNFFGALATTRAVLPSMRTRRTGRIITVSSIAAFGATATQSVYAASKWALEGWAEALAVEVAPFGVQVALIEPGIYRTAIWDSAVMAGADDSPYAPLRRTTEANFRRMAARTARDPREVGDRVVALLDADHMPLRNPIGPEAKAAWVMRGRNLSSGT